MRKSDVNYALSVKEHVGLPQSHYKLPRNKEHSVVFFLFYLGPVSKNPSTQLERTLKISVANLTPQNREIFTVLRMVGCKFLPPTMETSVKLWGYVKLYSQGVLF